MIPFFHRAVNLTARVLIGCVLPLVIELLALAQRDLDLDAGVFQINGERNDGVAVELDLGGQPLDLTLVHEQAARADRVLIEDVARERADKRCAGSLVSALERTVSGYTSCNETSRDIHLKRGKVHYALLPVWILNTRWEGKDFLFAMNGQTGKLVGKLPVSTKRVVGLFAAIAALLIAISVTALLLLVR